MGGIGINNLLADQPEKEQISAICLEKNKSEEVKKLCKKWEK
jgi:hypothetical protein